MKTRLFVLIPLTMAFFGEGCRVAQFDPASKVEAVRILATRSDKPYAKPGDTVNMEVLVDDGRAIKRTPMNVYWIPIPCIDPVNDAYYACYPGFAQLKPGVDLTPVLQAGTRFSFTMPADVITKHTKRNGSMDAVPDGLAVIFTIACAGHVEYIPASDNGVLNQLPLGCFDDQHHQLGPDDYVFAFSLVYAFDDRSNANPVVDHLTFAGVPIDLNAGITLDHCGSAAADVNGAINRNGCMATPMDVVIQDESWEVDPSNVDPASGKPLKESIRVHYFVTDGKFENDTINLFDPTSGRIMDTKDNFTAPPLAGENTIWAVVRDNRGGATWFTIPLHVR
ncbi:MAG: hypothetical protein ABIP39_11400 [Polyangiaceae bacterium]